MSDITLDLQLIASRLRPPVPSVPITSPREPIPPAKKKLGRPKKHILPTSEEFYLANPSMRPRVDVIEAATEPEESQKELSDDVVPIILPKEILQPQPKPTTPPSTKITVVVTPVSLVPKLARAKILPVVQHQQPLSRTYDDIDKLMDRANERHTAPRAHTPDDLAKLIQASQMTPLRDSNGWITDAATFAAKCARGHIHKYFIVDITANHGIRMCMTCSHGIKFMVAARTLAEDILKVPFVLKSPGVDEYINPVIKVILACNKLSGNDTSEQRDQYLVIHIHNTASDAKLKKTLYTYLHNHKHLNQIQLRAIRDAVPKTQTKKLAPTPLKTRKIEKIVTTSLPQVCIEDVVIGSHVVSSTI